MRRWMAAVLVAGLLVAGLGPASASGPTGATARAVPIPDGRLDILPLGDSITQGLNTDGQSGCGGPNRQSDSYRFYLSQHLLDSARLRAMYAGNRQWGCNGNRWVNAEGGRTITDAIPQVQGWLNRPEPEHVVPDLVLLNLGTNDALRWRSGAQMLADMSTLLDRILAYDPNIRVIVAQISLSSGRDPAHSRAQQVFNRGLPGLAAAKGARVGVADMQPISYHLWDGVHPDDGGNRRMAYQWYRSPALREWYGTDGLLPEVKSPWDYRPAG